MLKKQLIYRKGEKILREKIQKLVPRNIDFFLLKFFFQNLTVLQSFYSLKKLFSAR